MHNENSANHVIIFDGEEDHSINPDYFFQHPVVEGITEKNIAQYYKATAIFKDTVKEVLKSTDIVTDFEETRRLIEIQSKTGRGLHLLTVMIQDLLGKEMADTVIQLIETVIKEELHED